MEHHQFDNNEWIQCKGCQRLYDTPCIFHRHVCQLQDQNTQESSSNSTSLSDTTTGICLLCQKFYFIQQESLRKNQIVPQTEENFELQISATKTLSDNSNVLVPSKVHSKSKSLKILQFWEAVSSIFQFYYTAPPIKDAL